MPRIRTIKPEFWDSPGTARASLRARLFYIALWGWADDWGIGTANPKQLIGYAFPNDDDVTAADFPRLAAEVADCYDVAWYEVDGRPYFAVPSWDSHQKNERRAAKRNPGPDQGFSTLTEMRGSSVLSDGKNTLGTGEQGNRGTEEQISPLPAAREEDFDEAYSHWPKKVERKASFEQFQRAARKVGVKDLIGHVVKFGDAYAATTERKYVPSLAVWLRHERWTDELPSKAGGPAKKIDPRDEWKYR